MYRIPVLRPNDIYYIAGNQDIHDLARDQTEFFKKVKSLMKIHELLYTDELDRMATGRFRFNFAMSSLAEYLTIAKDLNHRMSQECFNLLIDILPDINNDEHQALKRMVSLNLLNHENLELFLPNKKDITEAINHIDLTQETAADAIEDIFNNLKSQLRP